MYVRKVRCRKTTDNQLCVLRIPPANEKKAPQLDEHGDHNAFISLPQHHDQAMRAHPSIFNIRLRNVHHAAVVVPLQRLGRVRQERRRGHDGNFPYLILVHGARSVLLQR
jgi:hypothetical protein